MREGYIDLLVRADGTPLVAYVSQDDYGAYVKYFAGASTGWQTLGGGALRTGDGSRTRLGVNPVNSVLTAAVVTGSSGIEIFTYDDGTNTWTSVGTTGTVGGYSDSSADWQNLRLEFGPNGRAFIAWAESVAYLSAGDVDWATGDLPGRPSVFHAFGAPLQ